MRMERAILALEPETLAERFNIVLQTHQRFMRLGTNPHDTRTLFIRESSNLVVTDPKRRNVSR